MPKRARPSNWPVRIGVLSAAERSDAAESLRAVHPDCRRRSRGRGPALRAAALRPDPSFGSVNRGATHAGDPRRERRRSSAADRRGIRRRRTLTLSPTVGTTASRTAIVQIASNTAAPHGGELSIISDGLSGRSATPGLHVVVLEGALGAAGSGSTSASISRMQASISATPVDDMSMARTVAIPTLQRWCRRGSAAPAGRTAAS